MISAADLLTHTRARASESAYLTALEASAVAFVERHTGRYFGAAAETTEYIIGSGSTVLWLSEPPSTDPTSVLERTVPGGASSTITASDASGFEVRGMRLVRKGGLAWGRGYEYEVTYERGYAAGSEPGDIRQLVKFLVAHWYERRVPVPKIGETHTFPVPMHAQQILDGWRRPYP